MKSIDVEPIDALDEKFREVLRAHGKEFCPDCGRHLTRMDAAWNNGETDAGTGHCVLEVICAACSCEIACVHSWYPSIDHFEEFIEVLENEWDSD